MTKIKKIMKLQPYSCGLPNQISGYEFEAFVKKHTGFHPHLGEYKLSVSFKVGKRRKLKKIRVEYYNMYNCDCCGPYYIARIIH